MSYCEDKCVFECCGLDAFSGDRRLISEWAQEAGLGTAHEALMQVEQLIAVAGDPSNIVSSDFLNCHTSNGNRRLLCFLEAFRTALRDYQQPHQGER